MDQTRDVVLTKTLDDMELDSDNVGVGSGSVEITIRDAVLRVTLVSVEIRVTDTGAAMI